MEGVLVSAATGALKAVTVKLATLLGDEFKHMKDVRKQIEPLSKELECMHDFLEKMSQDENPDVQDKRWMTDVREMSYDVEDNLDDFLISLGHDKSAKPKGLIKKCKKLLNKKKANWRISKAIEDFKTQIKEVRERNQRYRTGVISTKDANEKIDVRALAIFKEASELVGINESKNELISLLTENGSSSQHQVKVVSVVGCGGLGKTTVAKQVYESLKDKFDCCAFVTVSRNPNMMEVLRTILKDVSRQEYAGDIPHLIEKISTFLKDKRYFIVVDDLWDSESWKIIKCSFIKSSCGSRIITTTRINDVAEYCSSSHQGHIYKLRPLNDEDSRGLFLKRIFGTKEGCPSHLAEVSNDILKKCGGLPLAIISIAGLLAGKAPTFDEWNKVQSSFGYALERQSDVNEMIQLLSLSYFDLPPHLRSCLLYLSMFPEDYIVEKDRLVLRWIAEGFIHEKNGFSQYELGERCFNELINRSLIQPFGSDWWGTPVSCRVHDTILEFIVSKAMEENFVTLFGVPTTICDPQRMIRWLSLQDRNEISDAVVDLREKMIYSHTRTVLVFGDCLDNLPSLDKFRCLRVLDLEDCRKIKTKHLAHLGGLLALRYLRLRWTRIHELPEEIGELQYLQTLDVRGNNELKELPSGVVHLVRLVNLLCDEDVRLPDGFGSMRLQRLETISLSCQPPGIAQELCQLQNLQTLMLELDVHQSRFIKGVVSSLSTLGAGSLNSLSIHTLNADSMNLMMEPWGPTTLNLKLLEIWGNAFLKFPAWIGLLDNLQQLRLSLGQLGPADIDLLGRLKALSYLFLNVYDEVADRSSASEEAKLVKITSEQGLFPSLRMIQVGYHDSCGLGLYFEPGAMPRLQELRLRFDRDKTGCLTNGEFDFGIQHLPCLATVTCSIGFGQDDGSVREALKVAVGSNPNHPRLRM